MKCCLVYHVTPLRGSSFMSCVWHCAALLFSVFIGVLQANFKCVNHHILYQRVQIYHIISFKFIGTYKIKGSRQASRTSAIPLCYSPIELCAFSWYIWHVIFFSDVTHWSPFGTGWKQAFIILVDFSVCLKVSNLNASRKRPPFLIRPPHQHFIIQNI